MPSRKSQKRPKKKRRQPESPKRRLAAWILLILAIPIIIGLIWTVIPKKSKQMSGPTFQKEGTLEFIDESGEVIAGIDIEIAADDLERERGLMWRRNMEPDQGMLFIMDRSEPQSFWMLNTYLALDIIFVDAERKIVNIASNTKPQSLDPVRSTGPAKYVVEVLGGYCAEKGVEAGDSIAFERI